MAELFKRTKNLKLSIGRFLDIISDSGILFTKAIEEYCSGDFEKFLERKKLISENERQVDEIRLSIEKEMYINTLIPDSRGDVLAILENTDDVMDEMKNTLIHLDMERPAIPIDYNADFTELSKSTIDTSEALILAIRAFFSEIYSVDNYIHKVHLYESETDHFSDSLVRKIFASELTLAGKQHLRYFVEKIENISDLAESVVDRISIYTIKRML